MEQEFYSCWLKDKGVLSERTPHVHDSQADATVLTA